MARRPGGWERVYAFLLYAYPRSFREEFGPELLQVMRDGRRALENGGSTGAPRFYLLALQDVLAGAARERADASREWISLAFVDAAPGRGVRWIGLGLVCLSVSQVVYDVATPELSMGIKAWLLTSVVALVGASLAGRRPDGGPAR